MRKSLEWWEEPYSYRLLILTYSYLFLLILTYLYLFLLILTYSYLFLLNLTYSYLFLLIRELMMRKSVQWWVEPCSYRSFPSPPPSQPSLPIVSHIVIIISIILGNKDVWGCGYAPPTSENSCIELYATRMRHIWFSLSFGTVAINCFNIINATQGNSQNAPRGSPTDLRRVRIWGT